MNEQAKHLTFGFLLGSTLTLYLALYLAEIFYRAPDISLVVPMNDPPEKNSA